MAFDTDPLDLLSAEAEYPRAAVGPVLDGIDTLLILGLSAASTDQLVDWKRRISTRLDLAADAQRGLAETKAKIERLVADGHPSEPKGIEDAKVAEEIDARLDVLRLARAKFHEARDDTAA